MSQQKHKQESKKGTGILIQTSTISAICTRKILVSANGMPAYKNFKPSFKKPSLMFQKNKEGGK